MVPCIDSPLFLLALAALGAGLVFYIRKTERPPKAKCVFFTLFVLGVYLWGPGRFTETLMIALVGTAIYNQYYGCKHQIYLIPLVLLVVGVTFLPPRNCFIGLFLVLAAYIGLAWYDEFAVCSPKLEPTGSFISRLQAPFKPQSYRDKAAELDSGK